MCVLCFEQDFKEMQVHHSLTLVLVVLSYTTGYFRVGLIMMLVLDPADVPLHGAKLLKYIADERCLGRTNSAWQVGCTLVNSSK